MSVLELPPQPVFRSFTRTGISKPGIVAERAQATLDVLRRRGWCQHKWSDDEGRVCLSGAAALAEASDLIYFLGERLGEPAWLWNDASCRTFEDVEALLLSLCTG